jgi:hypothetical protein
MAIAAMVMTDLTSRSSFAARVFSGVDGVWRIPVLQSFMHSNLLGFVLQNLMQLLILLKKSNNNFLTTIMNSGQYLLKKD